MTMETAKTKRFRNMSVKSIETLEKEKNSYREEARTLRVKIGGLEKLNMDQAREIKDLTKIVAEQLAIIKSMPKHPDHCVTDNVTIITLPSKVRT